MCNFKIYIQTEYCVEPLGDIEKHRIGTPETVIDSTTFKNIDGLEFDDDQLTAVIFFKVPVDINELKLQSRGIKQFTVQAGTSTLNPVRDESKQPKVGSDIKMKTI